MCTEQKLSIQKRGTRLYDLELDPRTPGARSVDSIVKTQGNTTDEIGNSARDGKRSRDSLVDIGLL